MADKRGSDRVRDQRKVLDAAARKRREQNQLERLFLDNHHEEPTVERASKPEFDSDWGKKGKKSRRPKKKIGVEVYKSRNRNFAMLLDEESDNFKPRVRNYVTAVVPPSKYPEKHFCSVCGFPSNYTCPVCGDRYCCVNCYGTHKDTRCLKWLS